MYYGMGYPLPGMHWVYIEHSFLNGMVFWRALHFCNSNRYSSQPRGQCREQGKSLFHYRFTHGLVRADADIIHARTHTEKSLQDAHADYSFAKFITS